jgi:hypothetical protein
MGNKLNRVLMSCLAGAIAWLIIISVNWLGLNINPPTGVNSDDDYNAIGFIVGRRCRWGFSRIVESIVCIASGIGYI